MSEKLVAVPPFSSNDHGLSGVVVPEIWLRNGSLKASKITAGLPL